MKKNELAGRRFKVYQGEKLEGLAVVKEVETLYAQQGEAFCKVRFIGETTDYYRWIVLKNEVKNEW